MSETPGWLTLPTMVHREDLDKAVAAVKDLRGQRDEAINELTSALEILSVKRDAAKVEWRRLFDAIGELLNEIGPDFDQGRRAYYDEMTALSQVAMGRGQAMPPHADIAKIFDHKWLDPQCIETGCQSLILRAALDRAEAEKADFRRLDDAGYAEITHLRAELAAAKQYGIDCLSAACVTHQTELAAAEAESDRLRAAYNDVRALNAQITLDLGAELAAMLEALEKISCIQDNWISELQVIEAIKIARTALQSHRRTEEAT